MTMFRRSSKVAPVTTETLASVADRLDSLESYVDWLALEGEQEIVRLSNRIGVLSDNVPSASAQDAPVASLSDTETAGIASMLADSATVTGNGVTLTLSASQGERFARYLDRVSGTSTFGDLARRLA